MQPTENSAILSTTNILGHETSTCNTARLGIPISHQTLPCSVQKKALQIPTVRRFHPIAFTGVTTTEHVGILYAKNLGTLNTSLGFKMVTAETS